MTDASPRRRTRRAERRVVLTARDVLVLILVGVAQPVTRAQVQQLLDVSTWASSELLRRLFDGGYIAVHTPEGYEGPNLYTLTEKGRQAVARATGQDPESIRVVRAVERRDLHHERTVALYVAVRLACTRAGWTLEWMFERDVRKALGGGGGRLVPDAVAVVDNGPHGRRAVAFEIDLGTENPSYVVHTKGFSYGQARRNSKPLRGCSDWAVAFVCESERRAHRLARALWDDADAPEGLFFFATFERLTSRTILTPGAWTTPAVTEDRAARLVSASPFLAPETDGQIGFGRLAVREAAMGHDSGGAPAHRFYNGERT